MPAFVKSPKDEKRWAKAKRTVESSKNKQEHAFSDNDWALTNHIYHNMAKVELIKTINADLLKSSDKSNYEGEDDEDYYFDNDSEDDQDYSGDNEEDQDGGGETFPEEGVAGAGGTEEEDQQPSRETKASSSKKASGQEQIASRYVEPTPEDLKQLRIHTIPQEMRMRQRLAMEADAAANPKQFHHGRVLQANLDHYQDHKDAYDKLTNSPQYKNASLADKMTMDRQFSEDWRKNNPSHASEGMKRAISAHKKGEEAKAFYDQNKQADIRNIIEGGALGLGGSAESSAAARQHAGGIDTDDPKGKQGVGIDRDQVTSFAMQDPEFINKLKEKYDPSSLPSAEELEYAGEGFKGAASSDIKRLLGTEPAANPQVNNFFNHYYPLIMKNKSKTINWLKDQGVPITHDSVEADVLHEVGMHGLIQAINDYKHDNPQGASFRHWASTKMKGLMRTAMKQFDKIPPEIKEMKRRHLEEKRAAAPKSSTPKSSMVELPESLKNMFLRPQEIKSAPPDAPPKPIEPSAPPAPAVSSTQAPEQPKNSGEILEGSNHPEKAKIIRRLKSAEINKRPTPSPAQPQAQPAQSKTKVERFKNFFDDDTIKQLQGEEED